MIRLLIVADIRLYLEGLAAILGRAYGLTVVGTASSRAGGINAVERLAPDVVLVDMAMPESSAFIAEIARLSTKPRVVALGIRENDGEVIACAEAGVSSYVTRDASALDLAKAVTGAMNGELNCSPRVAAALLQRVSVLAARDPANHVRTDQLTQRELEVGGLVRRGLSNKEIARELTISVSTVKNHVHNILDKLHVTCRREAAALLLRVNGESPRR